MTRTVILAGCFSILLGVSMRSAPQPTAEQQVAQIIREIEAARPKNEVSVFRRHVADDYTGVNSRGTLLTKADVLTGVQRDTFTKYVVDHLKVRVYGDAAIASGRATYTATFEGVAYTDRQILFTTTYIRRNWQWQETASQSTVVAAQQK